MYEGCSCHSKDAEFEEKFQGLVHFFLSGVWNWAQLIRSMWQVLSSASRYLTSFTRMKNKTVYTCRCVGSFAQTRYMHMSKSMTCTVTWSHVDIRSLCCPWGLWWCPWPLQEDGCVDVCGLHCYLRPCWALWHILLSSETVCKSMICASLIVKGKEAMFAMVLMTTDSQLRKRDIEGFCVNLYPSCQKTKTA